MGDYKDRSFGLSLLGFGVGVVAVWAGVKFAAIPAYNNIAGFFGKNEKPAVSAEASAESVAWMQEDKAEREALANMSSELDYKYPAWLVTQNPDNRFDPLRGWLDDNTAINPDAAITDCPAGTACDDNTIPVGYVVGDSDNTITTYLCNVGNSGVCSGELSTVSTRATEDAIDEIVRSAGGLMDSTIAFPGSRLENVLASGYTTRDFASFAHNLNQGYDIDFLQTYIADAKEVRIVSNEGCTDPRADTMLSIEYSDDDWIDFNMTDEQHMQLLKYFAESN